MDNEPTVFVIDDDLAVRQSTTTLVKSMQYHAESYPSAQAFLAAYDPMRPGCLLLDVRMPGTSGLELLKRLMQDEIHLPVILISAYGDVPMVVQAMKCGALNFLEKPCRDQQLWEAIREAIEWDAANRKHLMQRAKIQRRMSQLSPGERDVLERLVDGRSNKSMAAELRLSVRTIEVRRAKVMRKMKARSLAELIRMTLVADNTSDGRANKKI